MIHLTVQQLSASLDGALTGPSLELVVRHLAACHDCRDRQARLAKHDDALRRLLGQDPADQFLDDLTRRTEALVTAISRGIPAPIMVTSVPLLHEEDPFAPAEPPPLPPRPELGRAGELAKEAGWGRIGMKPTGSPQAPESDAEEARRMLEALAGGDAGDFTELTAQGLQEHARIDGPVFDLPAWIKDQSGRAAPRTEGPRDIPKLSLYFEQLDEHAAGFTHEAANEVFRHDLPPESRAPEAGFAAPAAGEPLPPAHGAYAPPGWAHDAAANPREEYEQPGLHSEYSPAERESVAGPAGKPGGAETYDPPARWNAERTPAARQSQPGWTAGAVPNARDQYAPPPWDSAPATPPVAFDPGAHVEPVTAEFGQFQIETAPRTRRGPGVDRAVVLALATVGALILIVLALQLAPATGRRHSPAPAPGQGSSLTIPPLVPESSRHGQRRSAPVPPKPHVRAAETQAPIESVIPPVIDPEPAPAVPTPESVSPPPAATTTPVPAPVESPAPQKRHTAAQKHPHATARLTHTVNPPAPVPATMPATLHPGAGTPATVTGGTNANPPAVTPASANPGAGSSTPAHDPDPAATTAEDSEWPLLCGQISDDAGQPVANARVSMAEISFATRTDARGHFCVSAPPGAHSLFVEASGFTPQRTAVTFSATSAEVHLKLQPAR